MGRRRPLCDTNASTNTNGCLSRSHNGPTTDERPAGRAGSQPAVQQTVTSRDMLSGDHAPGPHARCRPAVSGGRQWASGKRRTGVRCCVISLRPVRDETPPASQPDRMRLIGQPWIERTGNHLLAFCHNQKSSVASFVD